MILQHLSSLNLPPNQKIILPWSFDKPDETSKTLEQLKLKPTIAQSGPQLLYL